MFFNTGSFKYSVQCSGGYYLGVPGAAERRENLDNAAVEGILLHIKGHKTKVHLECSLPFTLSHEGIQPQGWALQDVSYDYFVCYQDFSEYVGL